ncbi:hypothetical protein BCR32DRAFT_284283 [Anaeromyces robustus]|uniref:Uncharacterized protein n=1 Tax=Anaeromyces robustus TaxID=1754192 RepID=A0A1Y1WS12_9FUNG|nr:hypothetical protein BCR32DRAFT_284283 [Anaeromyces robustus]|eukprot:ORX76330.1 hypothetical protein BCR32DRAFT_284283 [Anaeromyces robustus]
MTVRKFKGFRNSEKYSQKNKIFEIFNIFKSFLYVFNFTSKRIWNLENLISIMIWYTKLQILPKEIGKIANLEKLNKRENKNEGNGENNNINDDTTTNNNNTDDDIPTDNNPLNDNYLFKD